MCDPAAMTDVALPACPAGQLCDRADGACKPIAAGCAFHQPGDAFCEAARRVVCGPDLVTRTEAACASAELCALGAGPTCAACRTGEHRCEGPVLKACNAEHTGFDTQKVCGTDRCDATSGCLVCPKNARSCASDTSVQICAADGLSTSTQPCVGAGSVCRDGKCTGCETSATCGDGLCPASCESPQSCMPDCGRLVFRGQQARRATTVDWAPDEFMGECGSLQAVVGLSTTLGHMASAVLCTRDDDMYKHGAASGCHAVALAATTMGNDWDVGFSKGECAQGEFMAGVAQSKTGELTRILCCPGPVKKQACARQVMWDSDGREAGAAASTGDWDYLHFKGECAPGRYVAGVSRTMMSGGLAHAILCCGK
jgi:hypothetical protein